MPHPVPANLTDPLENHFWKIVQTKASENDFTITLNCEYKFKEFILSGVTKLRTENVGTVPKTEVESAEMVLIRLVNEMIEWSNNRGVRELNELSFSDIKEKLCPCRPFC